MARQFVRKNPFGNLNVNTKLDMPLDFGTWDEPEFTNLLDDGLSPQQAVNKLNQDLPFEKLKYKPNQYKNPLDLANQLTTEGMDDYDLFKSIHYSPSKYGRDNYVKGEEEEIWNKLSEHFDMPKFDPYRYSFGVNDKDKIVELFQNGVAGRGGFGDWIVKPRSLGPLKRRK